MKIAIIGATGKAGMLIMKECLRKKYNVTAIVRDSSKLDGLSKIKILQKKILDLTKKDLSSFDVIINAFGVSENNLLDQYIIFTTHLLSLLEGTKIRYIVVGGAGSLFTDNSHKMHVFESLSFPKEFLNIAIIRMKELDILKASKNVRWTFFSPAIFFDEKGKETGKYIIGNDEVIMNSENKSYISYADYAIALVDEIKNKNFINKQFTAVSN
ncbi:NAD(P)-dependent oxidoreductase [Mycoplasmoides alvi]|uniref:NAD(P)-dependent oxidoreductase n=1 Tax=Mycoplasmoides alvi TaxID=78580 RepID=UPI00051B74F8|nr:NAD(P)H-binding protein [Mycoplasmoides alvi]